MTAADSALIKSSSATSPASVTVAVGNPWHCRILRRRGVRAATHHPQHLPRRASKARGSDTVEFEA